MPSSLVKFANRTQAPNGQKLFWDRVGIDNLPFRGAHAPMLTSEEFEDRAVRVADARNAFFDVMDPTQNKQYLDVVECVWNGWFRLVHLERFWVDEAGNRTTKHYVEWVEFYLEDGTRTPFLTGGITELAHGQQNLANFGPG